MAGGPHHNPRLLRFCISNSRGRRQSAASGTTTTAATPPRAIPVACMPSGGCLQMPQEAITLVTATSVPRSPAITVRARCPFGPLPRAPGPLAGVGWYGAECEHEAEPPVCPRGLCKIWQRVMVKADGGP